MRTSIEAEKVEKISVGKHTLDQEKGKKAGAFAKTVGGR